VTRFHVQLAHLEIGPISIISIENKVGFSPPQANSIEITNTLDQVCHDVRIEFVEVGMIHDRH
jgi:hypothetical protein